LEKVPAVDPALVEDVIWGNAQPAGEAGYNVARVTALLAGLDGAPGVTVNRFRSGMSDGGPGTHNEKFADAEARTEKRTQGGFDSWAPIGGLPDIYIAMGQTAENV